MTKLETHTGAQSNTFPAQSGDTVVDVLIHAMF